jgi:hypothetical protein
MTLQNIRVPFLPYCLISLPYSYFFTSIFTFFTSFQGIGVRSLRSARHQCPETRNEVEGFYYPARAARVLLLRLPPPNTSPILTFRGPDWSVFVAKLCSYLLPFFRPFTCASVTFFLSVLATYSPCCVFLIYEGYFYDFRLLALVAVSSVFSLSRCSPLSCSIQCTG